MIGITEKSHAWLRISGLKPEVQNIILNAPFNEEQLFGSAVNDTLI